MHKHNQLQPFTSLYNSVPALRKRLKALRAPKGRRKSKSEAFIGRGNRASLQIFMSELFWIGSEPNSNSLSSDTEKTHLRFTS